MRLKSLLVAFAVLIAAAACVRLGFWQLGRWEQKRHRNALTRSLLAGPAQRLEGAGAPAESLVGRKVVISGRYDERRQILLLASFHEGEPGVEVVTPLLTGGGRAVLVDRGWLASPDAASARPQDFPEPGPRVVEGVADSIGRGPPGSTLRESAADSTRVLATETLDLDSVRTRFPYPIAPWLVRQLPGPGVPDRPLRTAPSPLNESMHLGYAIQWFAIAVIILVGSAALARSRRQARTTRTTLC